MQRRFLILPVAVAFGLAAEQAGYGWGDPGHWVPDLAVGWFLIGCELIASARHPESRAGVLMSATGFTWFLGNFAGVGVTVVASIRRSRRSWRARGRRSSACDTVSAPTTNRGW
jgi:hypothetical protein